MKKSITVVGKQVNHAYVIRNIDVDKVTIEKYEVDCRSDIAKAWENTVTWEDTEIVEETEKERVGQTTLSNDDEQTFEIVLKDKISEITLKARAHVVEVAAKAGGKIIKDFVVERPKGGRTAYLIDLIFFKEVVK